MRCDGLTLGDLANQNILISLCSHLMTLSSEYKWDGTNIFSDLANHTAVISFFLGPICCPYKNIDLFGHPICIFFFNPFSVFGPYKRRRDLNHQLQVSIIVKAVTNPWSKAKASPGHEMPPNTICEHMRSNSAILSFTFDIIKPDYTYTQKFYKILLGPLNLCNNITVYVHLVFSFLL